MRNIIYLYKGGNVVRKKVTIFDVSDYFLSKLNIDKDSSITPLKLQKLVYYAQVWSLVWDHKNLFDEHMEAWAHGPVNPDLYSKYKSHRWESIEPINEIKTDIFTKEQLDTMDAVWDGYGDYDGKYLEKLTHQEDPWIDARGDCLPGEYCNTIIDINSMKSYYTEMYNGDM